MKNNRQSASTGDLAQENYGSAGDVILPAAARKYRLAQTLSIPLLYIFIVSILMFLSLLRNSESGPLSY